MNIYLYQAECGDAARFCYTGTDGTQHTVFIDSGFERTFRAALKADIKALERTGIDLWIVTHIHDDHIGGIIAYIKAVQSGEINDIVKEWQYNPPRFYARKKTKPARISTAKGIRQGDLLYDYLAGGKKNLTSGIFKKATVQDLHGLKLITLSPDTDSLEKLRRKYKNKEYIDYQEITSISEAKAALGDDYATRLIDFDIYNWEEDGSIENRSSIVSLLEFKGKNYLWLADSHPGLVIDSLTKLGYSKKNPLTCEWVKVAHHGSKGNNSLSLYEHIRCTNYILSVNGENKHYLPSKECIARILRNPERPEHTHYTLHFTYDNESLRNIFKVDGPDVFKEFNFSVQYQSDTVFFI